MAKNITATANGATVSGSSLKYVVSNLGSNIKSVTYNGTEYWKSDSVIIGSGADYTGGWTGISERAYLNAGGSWGALSSSGLYDMKCLGSYGNHGGAVNVYSNQKISLTEWSTMTLTYKIHGDAWGSPPSYSLILADNTTDYTFAGNAGNSAFLSGRRIFYYEMPNDDGSAILGKTQTATINISGITGSYYLDFYANAGVWTTSGKMAQWDVTGLILA